MFQWSGESEVTSKGIGGNFGFDADRNGGEELDGSVSFIFSFRESLFELGDAIEKILILHAEEFGMK